MYYNKFDIVVAHYLFYRDHYNSQWSTFYKRLCRISRYFKPSPLMSFDIFAQNENVQYIYQGLCDKYEYDFK